MADENTFVTEKNIEFSLVNEDVYEDTSIWAVYNKRNETIKDIRGNELSFPIKEGILIGKDGKEYDFNTIVKMPPFIFKNIFPDLNKTTKLVRCISISGVGCYYAFTKTSNKKLNDNIATLKATGTTDITQVVFKQSYDAKAAPADKYNISVIGKIGGAVEQPQTPAIEASQTPVAEEAVAETPTPTINVDGVNETPVNTPTQPVVLNQTETELLKAVKELPMKLDEEKFKQLCTQNNITDEARITVLWSEYQK